jgi:hypothetical protein
MHTSTTTLLIEQKQKWEINLMSTRQQTEPTRSNQYSAGPVCDYCAGVTRHEKWCVTCNAIVRYAYGAIAEGGRLTLGDELSLHALGVEWSSKASTDDIPRR